MVVVLMGAGSPCSEHALTLGDHLCHWVSPLFDSQCPPPQATFIVRWVGGGRQKGPPHRRNSRAVDAT